MIGGLSPYVRGLMTTATRSVTIRVRDPDQASGLFRRRMGLETVRCGVVPDDILKAWGLLGAVSGRFTGLSQWR